MPTMKSLELAFDVYEYESTRSDLNPIVMMTGIGWCKFVYRELARDICLATKRKVYSIDHRNHGESPSSNEVTLVLFIEDVKNFLEKQNLKRVAFVCHSFSSSVAYCISLDMPEAVERIVMIDNPPFLDFNDEFQRVIVYPQLSVQKRLLRTINNKMSLKEARAKFCNLAKMANKGHEHFYNKAAYDLKKENGKFGWKMDFEFLMAAFEKGNFYKKARGFSNKEILIVRCENSVAVSDEKFKAVQRHNPRAKLLTFENTTHLLMFEHQEKFVQTVKEFMHISDHPVEEICNQS